MDLWRQRMQRGRAEGDPERLTAGIGMTSAALSPDGGRIAYSLARMVSNVWRVPISLDRPATWADAEQITFQEAFIGSLDVSPDGARLALSSNRSGNPDLWVLSTDGGEMEQLTTDRAADVAPAWSPSGEERFTRTTTAWLRSSASTLVARTTFSTAVRTTDWPHTEGRSF